MSDYKSFIIHLQRSEGRKARVQDLLSKSPFDAEVVDAVDGRLLSKAQVDACYSEKRLARPKYPFVLNSGEIGCFKSHRAVWKRIVDQDLKAGLILEDDVQIDPTAFMKSIEAAQVWSEQYGYIQFQVRSISEKCQVLGEKDGIQLLRPIPAYLRTSAQLVTQKTARQLLKVSEKFDRPVDVFLQMHWVTKVPLVCVTPSGVSDRTQETGGSTLSVKKPGLSKISREWKRFVYRRKVVRYSKRSIV